MSRSKGGRKKEYIHDMWFKQKGSVTVACKSDIRTSRMQRKEQDRKELEESLFEFGEGNYDLSQCPVYKSLFPNAKTIEYYHHYICGYDVLVVDGKFHGELSRVDELLAFQYHTGESYKDIEELENKYFEYLESYERWSFLP